MGLFDHIKKALFGSPPSEAREAERREDETVAIPDIHELIGLPAPTDSTPTGAQILQMVHDLNVPPAAFQALWDGDTEGWFLCLDVVYRSGARHTGASLACLRFGGDIRVFNGQVPPWPEAVVGAKIGEALARRFGVPFFFPSPKDPDDDCPNWWEQDRAIHCQDCDKLILPRESPHLPKEICYHCHLDREQAEKIRTDAPCSPDGVTVLLEKGDGYERISSSSDTKYLPIAELALRELGREADAREKGQVFLEGADLEALAVHLDVYIKEFIRNFKQPDERLARFLACFEREVIRIEYEGQTLEFNEMDPNASDIFCRIDALKSVKRALQEQSRIWLVFRRGMTERSDRVLRVLHGRDGLATVQQIAGEIKDDLDEVAVRRAIQQLEGLGHVRCNGDEVRLTEMGKYIL